MLPGATNWLLEPASTPVKYPCALAKCFRFHARSCQYLQEQITQRRVIFRRDVTTMVVSASSKNQRQVTSVVHVGVAEVAAKQY